MGAVCGKAEGLEKEGFVQNMLQKAGIKPPAIGSQVLKIACSSLKVGPVQLELLSTATANPEVSALSWSSALKRSKPEIILDADTKLIEGAVALEQCKARLTEKFGVEKVTKLFKESELAFESMLSKLGSGAAEEEKEATPADASSNTSGETPEVLAEEEHVEEGPNSTIRQKMESFSFSVLRPERSLDIICTSGEQRIKWVTDIKEALERRAFDNDLQEAAAKDVELKAISEEAKTEGLELAPADTNAEGVTAEAETTAEASPKDVEASAGEADIEKAKALSPAGGAETPTVTKKEVATKEVVLTTTGKIEEEKQSATKPLAAAE